MFYHTNNLNVLDISYNKITHLISSIFLGIVTLNMINLKDNPIIYVSANFYEKVEVRRIDTDSYKVCCTKPRYDVTCDAKPDWPNSCGNLINDVMSNIMIWCVGILGLIFNSIVLLPKQTKGKENKNYKIIICNVAASDLFFCQYLISLAVASAAFYGRYVEIEATWRGSWICVTACSLFVSANFLSVFFMHLLAVSTYSVVRSPLHSYYLQKNFIIWHQILGFAIIVPMSLGLIVLYWFLSKDGLMPTGLCLLVGNIDKSLIPTILTWLNILCQGVPIITIPIINGLLIVEKTKADKGAMAIIALGQQRAMHGMTARFFIASSTNLLGWIASTTLLLQTLFWHEYPYHVLVLTVIIALPLNSLLNPFVLVFSTDLVKWFKKFSLGRIEGTCQ